MSQAEEFAGVYGISVKEAEKVLKHHASRWGGCVACKHSLPGHLLPQEEARGIAIPPWHRRSCPYGMRQDDCTMFERIE